MYDMKDQMIDRTPVSQAVAKQLQKMIRNGELATSERLPSQRALAERLGVSRPSLREALMTLETLGLIRTYPGRGTFVSNPQDQTGDQVANWRYSKEYSIADVFEVRLLLEGQLARHAAESATLADISQLTATTDRMEAAWERGDLIANVDEDQLFHQHIASKSQNILLQQTYDSLGDLLTETQRQPIPFTALERMADSIKEHREIISAIHARDADQAQAAMIRHIRNTADCAGVAI